MQPVEPGSGRLLLLLAVLSALALLVGFCTRAATALALATFAYLFALDVSTYSNHLVLMLHLLATAQVVDWGNWGSVDRLLHERS